MSGDEERMVLVRAEDLRAVIEAEYDLRKSTDFYEPDSAFGRLVAALNQHSSQDSRFVQLDHEADFKLLQRVRDDPLMLTVRMPDGSERLMEARHGWAEYGDDAYPLVVWRDPETDELLYSNDGDVVPVAYIPPK